ncbi:MAG: hypothetical protein U5R30_09675 [Deltaproteobacteria bacterium]|nr:hypothetical protein [Deltaproteobacteria bacterium]
MKIDFQFARYRGSMPPTHGGDPMNDECSIFMYGMSHIEVDEDAKDTMTACRSCGRTSLPQLCAMNSAAVSNAGTLNRSQKVASGQTGSKSSKDGALP